jgi:threonine aldolase
VNIDPESIQTNIVIFDIADTRRSTLEFSAALKSRGVLANGINQHEMRMVTHYDVSRTGIEQALLAARDAIHEGHG